MDILNDLGLLPLLLIFIVAAVAVWIAGIHLSRVTDILATRWGLGKALGGLLILAIVTNLPELAITISGALSGELGIVTGNILGGIAIQTVVLVFLDIYGLGKTASLSYKGASLSLVLEALLVIGVLAVCLMGTQLPAITIFHLAPAGFIALALWIVGLWLIGRSRKRLPWQEKGQPPNGQIKPRGHSQKKKNQQAKEKDIDTSRTVLVFILAAIVTLVCGIILERSGTAIADEIGMSGVVFGAVVLAAATALPELSTGLSSVKMKDYQLAISDIFGGNAFLPALFFLASALSGTAVLPHAMNTDIYLTALGVLLTAVYATGLIFRPKKQILRMGIDSLLVLVLYLCGIIGLIAMTQL